MIKKIVLTIGALVLSFFLAFSLTVIAVLAINIGNTNDVERAGWLFSETSWVIITVLLFSIASYFIWKKNNSGQSRMTRI